MTPPTPSSNGNAPPQQVQLLLLGAVRSRSSGGTSRRSSSSSRSSSTADSDAASYSVQSSNAFTPSSTAAGIASARPASPASFQALVAPSSSASLFSSPASGSTAIAIDGVSGRHYSSANGYRPLLPGPFEAPADDGEYDEAPGYRWQTHYASTSLISTLPAALRRLRSTVYRLTLFAATWLPRILRAAPRRLARVFLFFLLPGFLLGVAALSAYMPLREDAPWAMTTVGDSAGSGTPPSTAPAARLAAPSPFSSMGCYLSQLKFLAGTVLFSDRLVDREPCTDRLPAAPAAVALTCPSCIVPLSESAFAHAPAALRASAAAVAAFASAHNNGGPPAAVHASVEWITYATSCSMGLRRLEISLDSAGIPLTLLGVHVPWRGWGQRLRAYHDHVAAVAAVDPDRLVVLSDGEDVFFAPVCSAADLVRRFLVLRGLSGATVIAAAESALWPDESLAEDYNRPNVVHRPPGVRDPRNWARTDVLRTGSPLPTNATDSKTHAVAAGLASRDVLARRGWTYGVPDREWLGPGSPMRHLNAGTLMGRAADVAALLHRVYTDDCIDDQLALTLAYLRPDMHWNEPTAADGDGGEGGDPGFDDATLVAAVDLAAWYYSDTELRFGQDSPEASAARDRLVHAAARHAFVSADRSVASSADVARRTLVVAAAGSVHGYPDPGRPRPLVAPSAALLPPPLPRYRLEPSPSSPPPRARPLLALDFEADLFVAMFNKTLVDFRRNAAASSASPASSLVSSMSATAAGHIDTRSDDDDDKGGGDLVYARTLGRP
ncbi:hypothetical protein HK405_006263, partial [Cladochytrium tenue]